MVQPLKVALASLVLNEEEFLSHNWYQHRDWPGMVSWVFVEGADKKYAEASPDLVSPVGLSTDRTSSILEDLAKTDQRVKYIPYGWMFDTNTAQSKTKGRDRYLEVFEEVRPDIFVVIDADEFYTREDQLRINELVQRGDYLAWRLAQRHLWRPPSLKAKKGGRFRLEVYGGYWAVRHVRVFRWRTGIRYRVDHNWPNSKQYRPLRHMYDGGPNDPSCIHMGFTRDVRNRTATHRYYETRGEGAGDGRQRYVSCRAAWETWKPGRWLPNNAYVTAYRGPIPEVFQ